MKLISFMLLASSSCAAAQTPPTMEEQQMVGKEQEENTLCIQMNATREAADKCRADVKAKYDLKFHRDGGVL